MEMISLETPRFLCFFLFEISFEVSLIFILEFNKELWLMTPGIKFSAQINRFS